MCDYKVNMSDETGVKTMTSEETTDAPTSNAMPETQECQPPPSKRCRVEDAANTKQHNNGAHSDAGTGDKSSSINGDADIVPMTLSDLSDVNMDCVLSCTDSGLAIQATHTTRPGTIILHIQKLPFDASRAAELLTGDTRLTQLLHNDVYSKHTAILPPHLNKVQVSMIHPATAKHLQRYERHSCTLIEETPAMYEKYTKPFIASGSAHSKQWIYNILEGSSEADRVVYRDDHPDTGFVLLPDIKWTGEQMDDLYCQALVVRRDLHSLRDLRAEHIPLLEHIRDTGAEIIAKRYGVERCRLRIYLHYLPSFYHLHVHFAALTFEAPGTWAGKCHLLGDVISCLRRDGEHYAASLVSYTLKDNHPHPLARDNIGASENVAASELPK